MNADTIAALERAAELIVNGGIRCQQDAALIRDLIKRERAGGERAQIVRIDPAEYQDGLYLNPVTGQVIRIAADAHLGGE